MPLPKRVTVRLDDNEVLALIDAATDYIDTAQSYIGLSNVEALEEALGGGVIDFALVKNLDASTGVLDQCQTYFYLSLALRQLQADYDRLRGQ